MSVKMLRLCLGIVWIFTTFLATAAPPAQPLQRIGSFPSGYNASGNYCLATSDKTKLAIPRTGSCPSGYYASNEYCVSTR